MFSVINLSILAVIIFLVYMLFITKKKVSLDEERQGSFIDKWTPTLHSIYSSNVITQNNYLNFYSEIVRNTTLTTDEVKYFCVPIFTQYYNMIVIGILTISLFTKNIVLLIVIYQLVEAIVNYNLYEKVCDVSIQTEKSIRILCEEIRQNYSASQRIIDSVKAVVPEINISHATNDLAELLGRTGKIRCLETVLSRYKLITFKLLVIVCELTNTNGDTKTSEGSSSLVVALNMLIAKISASIQTEVFRKQLFRNIANMILIFFLAIIAMNKVLQLPLPGLKSLMSGPIGFILTIVLIVYTSKAYKYVAFVNRKPALDVDERTRLERRLFSKEWIKKLASCVYLSKKEYKEIYQLLRETYSTLTVEFVQFRIMIKAVFNYLLVMIVMITAVFMAQTSIKNSIEGMSLSKSVNTPQQVEQLEKLNEEFYSKEKELGRKLTVEETTALIKSHVRGLSLERLDSEVSRLRTNSTILEYAKINILTAILIPLLAAYGAKGTIVRGIRERKKTIESYQDENTLALLISVVMIMNMNIKTLDILNVMRNSTDIYTTILDQAYHRYVGMPNRALFKLKNAVKSTNFEFRQIVGRIEQTVNAMSPREAFCNKDKEFYDTLNRQSKLAEYQMEDRAKIASRKSNIITIGAMIYLVIPILGVVVSLLLDMLGSPVIRDTLMQLGVF